MIPLPCAFRLLYGLAQLSLSQQPCGVVAMKLDAPTAECKIDDRPPDDHTYVRSAQVPFVPTVRKVHACDKPASSLDNFKVKVWNRRSHVVQERPFNFSRATGLSDFGAELASKKSSNQLL